MTWTLRDFVRESFEIERIYDDARVEAAIPLHADFLALWTPDLDDVKSFVGAIEPGTLIRDRPTLNVRVGSHVPPRGGEHIVRSAEALLYAMRFPQQRPYWVYCEWETLHPFLDGNGRSGRLLWLWSMTHNVTGERPGNDEAFCPRFLTNWHYQTLDAYNGRRGG